MIGRNTCDAELERDLGTKPFETYELFRGQKFGAEDDGDYREVGKFKVCACLRALSARVMCAGMTRLVWYSL